MEHSLIMTIYRHQWLSDHTGTSCSQITDQFLASGPFSPWGGSAISCWCLLLLFYWQWWGGRVLLLSIDVRCLWHSGGPQETQSHRPPWFYWEVFHASGRTDPGALWYSSHHGRLPATFFFEIYHPLPLAMGGIVWHPSPSISSVPVSCYILTTSRAGFQKSLLGVNTKASVLLPINLWAGEPRKQWEVSCDSLIVPSMNPLNPGLWDLLGDKFLTICTDFSDNPSDSAQ